MRRLATALVLGIVLTGTISAIGTRAAGAAEVRDDVVCDGDRGASQVVVEDVGDPAGGLPAAVPSIDVPVGFEQIHDYTFTMVLDVDGSADVTETIVYDFGRTPDRHGILRDLRLTQPCNAQWERVYPMSRLQVSSPSGAPTAVKTETANGITTVRVGDADKNVHGIQTYVVQYRLGGVVNGFSDHDELYWNAIGPEWNVTVWNGVVDVRAPAAPRRITCFSGPVGVTTTCDAANVTDGVAQFQQQTIPARSALTVVAAYPKGTFTATPRYYDEKWSVDRAFTRNPLTVGVSGVLLAGVVAGVAALLYSVGRDRRAVGAPTDVAFAAPGTDGVRVGLLEDQRSPVDVVPPDAIRPAQLGLVRNEEVRDTDVSATIVDLAVRGYLRIEELGERKRDRDYKLVRLRDPDERLLPYETMLMSSLFTGGTEVVLSELEDTFAAKLAAVKRSVYDDGVERGWFSERPDRVVRRWRAIGFALTVVGAGLLAAAIAWTKVALLPVPILIGGLLIWLFARRFPARTPAGTGMRRRASGFEIFMRDSEAPRARWAEQRNIFSEYLPYAVVLGLATKWAQTFEPLGAEAVAGTAVWYSGTEPFSARSFGDATASFTSATASTLASVPQSSSGSSGFSGGSSGGGGGGGGGGSW